MRLQSHFPCLFVCIYVSELNANQLMLMLMADFPLARVNQFYKYEVERKKGKQNRLVQAEIQQKYQRHITNLK